MILLFTSKHCVWCSTVKSMVEAEIASLTPDLKVHEIDVDLHNSIARAYGVSTVPTLVFRNSTLSGLPSPSDLQSFILQASPGADCDHNLLDQLMRRVRAVIGGPINMHVLRAHP